MVGSIVAEKCKKLKRMVLRHCEQVTDQMCNNLAKCMSLEVRMRAQRVSLSNVCVFQTVDLCKCTPITDPGIMVLARNCELLSDVFLNYCHFVTDDGVAELCKARFVRLHSLRPCA